MWGICGVLSGGCFCVCVFFFKQKTAYEICASDGSSDGCCSEVGCLERRSGCGGSVGGGRVEGGRAEGGRAEGGRVEGGRVEGGPGWREGAEGGGVRGGGAPVRGAAGVCAMGAVTSVH